MTDDQLQNVCNSATLRQWMSARIAKNRRGPKLQGLSRAEAAAWLTHALKREITPEQIKYWLLGKNGVPAIIPKDVLAYIKEPTQTL